MPTAIITGANSGIGHEFAKVLIKEGYDVHAVDVQDGEKLKSLGCKTSQLDVTSEDAIDKFKQEYGDGPLDLLLNVAGTLDAKHDSLTTINAGVLSKTFAVNTFGPLLLTQAFLPNILKSSAPPRLGYVSSRVGSIADNSSGGSYAYRSSKAALNMICKNLSVELKDKGVIVVILHPGIVRTGLTTGPHGLPELPGAVGPDEVVGELYDVLVSKKLEDTGKFWHRNGQELPW
ncbi:short-chain dehydrogenase [Diplodia corticola]|uniref:Short-chain dehydrogenase n=1 Tax=Diplodia corticola TaxID=236234 RepID=A0A1J9RVA0_9PEZI|nr:short-chain dehydrogenase [Diplodia corticola]OJD31780.1 short-chain dehydrogenase [Diplodia corticola]